MYCSPRADKGESPPIFPSTLNWLSPCFRMIGVFGNDTQRMRLQTYPRKEDAARLDMQIHQVERDPALQIPMYARHGDLAPDVRDAQVREVRLGDRLVHLLVLRDAAQEVALRDLARHVLVVGVAGADLQVDVRGDNGRVVAEGLEKDHDDALFFRDARFDFGSVR